MDLDSRHGHLRLLGAPAPGPHGELRLPAGPGVLDDALPPGGLRVAVLGPLVISGTPGELQPRQAELVAALALAGRGGLAPDVLRTRLGTDPDHPKDPDLLRQVIARTRRRLGTTPMGGEYIVYDGARYRLDAAAWVDLDEFRALSRAGRAARDPRPLAGALALLRGYPLDGVYWWWLDIVLAERVRAEAVDTAVLLSRLALEAGDPVTGRQAALAGLTVDQAAEELWRQLMLAEDMAGNAAGVLRAWVMCQAAIADIAPDGDPHPATAGLYENLTAPRARRAGLTGRPGAEALHAMRLAEWRAAGCAAG